MPEPGLENAIHSGAFGMRVGQLFITFAGFETAMVAVLKSHLSRAIGPKNGDDGGRALALAVAIYGSMRFQTSRDTMNRIMEAEGAASNIREAAKAIFDQVGNIGSLRDKLAHFATKPVEGQTGYWSTTDYFSNRNLANSREFVVATDAIGFAAEDLTLATQKIWASKGELDLFSEEILKPIAWKYKPSMLASQR